MIASSSSKEAGKNGGTQREELRELKDLNRKKGLKE